MSEHTITATAPAARGGGTAAPGERVQPSWKLWVLPSFADIFFLVFSAILAFTPASAALLGDADTGWHIRNGETILATRSVPHTDPFSYTKAGQPWYAWEWLYDVVVAIAHHFAGLNGVVLFTAVVIAFTFALLFRFLLRRSGNFAVSVGLTLLAAAAAQIHMLARPHVVSWLFVLLWLEALYRFEEGKRAALLWLPPLMLLWVNVHGSFLLGLVLLGLFGCGHLWTLLTKPDAGERGQLARLAIAFCVCVGATFLTPYGYKLHVHVYQFLSDHFLINSIDEYASPNFHATGYGYFEVVLLLSFLGVMLAYRRVSARDLLLLIFAAHSALYAARNIPVSAVIMSLVIGPLWANVLSDGDKPDWRRRLAFVFDPIEEISESMGRAESRFRGHALAVVALAACTALAVHGGRLGSVRLMSAHFNEKDLPVKAADFIAAQGIHDHLFNSDRWSGYLIYRLYPQTKLFCDDRFDFYGEAFMREYLQIVDAKRQWSELLDKYQVQWVLIGDDTPLASVLKASRGWRVEFDDGMAMIFRRQSGSRQ